MLKLGFTFCFMLWLGLQMAFCQTGQVPELVGVQEANKILITEIPRIEDEIKAIESGGGVVHPELRLKLQLFKAVNAELEKNSIGMTTFNAVAGNSNYKGLKMDDQAYQDFVDGSWDENMSYLIRVLTK